MNDRLFFSGIVLVLILGLVSNSWAQAQCTGGAGDPCKGSYVSVINEAGGQPAGEGKDSEPGLLVAYCVDNGVQVFWCDTSIPEGYRRGSGSVSCGPAGLADNTPEEVAITATKLDGSTKTVHACQCKATSYYCQHPVVDCSKITSCDSYTSLGENACKNNDCKTQLGGKDCHWDKASSKCLEGVDPCASITSCEQYLKDETSCTSNKCQVGDKTTSACKWDATAGCSTASTTVTTTGGEAGSEVIAKIKEAVKNLACTVYAIIYYTASGFVALVLLLSGVKWMTSDETSGRIEARRRLAYALIGLMVIILACPIINFFFANTDLVKKGPCDCGNLPFSGGGPGPTPYSSCSSNEKDSGVDGSTCAKSTDCSKYDTGSCGHYCSGSKCYAKRSVGEECDPAIPVEREGKLMCQSNICSSSKCQNEPTCTSSSSLDLAHYCGSDGFPYKTLSDGSGCGASQIHSGENPDRMCISKWCTSQGCRSPYGECYVASDCESSFHYGNNRFCNPVSWLCEAKRAKDKPCKAGDEVNSNADKVCQSPWKCIPTTGKCG